MLCSLMNMKNKNISVNYNLNLPYFYEKIKPHLSFHHTESKFLV